ncbi:MAG: DUF3592 domain-containing protein [Leptolyngbyaceae cyanobacterium bins.59]|nr:DUF3592 domain-containing protein [Leptolyngbyaceae cyanobacterium bins.59]
MQSKAIVYLAVAICSIFPLTGIGLLIGAFSSYRNTSSFVKAASRSEGTVVDMVVVDTGVNNSSRSRSSIAYRPTIHFIDHTGEKVEFTSSVGTNPPSYSKGQKVEILYHPDEPENAQINDFGSLWGDSITLGGMGGGFLIIGMILMSIPFVVFVLPNFNKEYLKKSGVPIQTKFQRVEINNSVSIDGVHPFVVLTQWQDPSTSELHIFRSDDLQFDPSDYMKSERITVFIEENNPKKYYVDLSFLPKPAE